jgi:parallel beta-helix repeat protein
MKTGAFFGGPKMRLANPRNMLAACVFLSVIVCPAAGEIIYVNDDANGVNDGTSWTDAYTELQPALLTSSSGDQIWIAAGTYTPDPCGLAEPREASFQMNNGVGIYGGFAGDEDPCSFELADRDFTTTESILSGDIGIAGNNADNCYCVIYNRQGTTLDSNAVLDGFTITGSNADSGALVFGGGMLNEGASDYPCSPIVTNCIFRDNIAQYGGGMVNSNYSSPKVTNCNFSGNISTYSYNGGGMINADDSSPNVTDCTFRDNQAVSGGGMGNTNSSPTVTNCTFHDNHAAAGGGMCNRFNSSPTVTDCTFSNNDASGSGGGMHNYECSPTVTDCTFSGNEASESGGGMRNDNSSSTVTNCIFIGNSATGTYFYNGGGGMFNDYCSSLTVTNCTFSGNKASVNGGGIYNYSSSPTVTNCTFRRNTADGSGGAMLNWSSSNPSVINCTFIGNLAGNGGGMYNYSLISPTVTNCILWGDEPDEIYNSSASPTVTYSDVQGGYAGVGNIDADPCFVDPNNPDPNLWNLRLKLVSPCIDAGNSTALVDVSISQDLDGLMRFVDIASVPNNGTGLFEFVDMGAYEFACNYTHGDVNCDGVVDFKDVAILCANWLAGAEPEL